MRLLWLCLLEAIHFNLCSTNFTIVEINIVEKLCDALLSVVSITGGTKKNFVSDNFSLICQCFPYIHKDGLALHFLSIIFTFQKSPVWKPGVFPPVKSQRSVNMFLYPTHKQG